MDWKADLWYRIHDPFDDLENDPPDCPECDEGHLEWHGDYDYDQGYFECPECGFYIDRDDLEED